MSERVTCQELDRWAADPKVGLVEDLARLARAHMVLARASGALCESIRLAYQDGDYAIHPSVDDAMRAVCAALPAGMPEEGEERKP